MCTCCLAGLLLVAGQAPDEPPATLEPDECAESGGIGERRGELGGPRPGQPPQELAASSLDGWLGVSLIYYALYTLIFVVGCVGNVLTLSAVFRKRALTSMDIFIANLAISDIMFSLFAGPVTVIYTLGTGFWKFGLFGCKVFSTTQAMSVYVNTFTMVAIAAHRYQLIMRPHERQLQSTRAAYRQCAAIWLAAAAINYPYFLHVKLVPEDCKNQYCSEKWPSDQVKIFFSFFTITMQLIMPTASVSFYYLNIFRRLQRRRPASGAGQSAPAKPPDSERPGETSFRFRRANTAKTGLASLGAPVGPSPTSSATSSPRAGAHQRRTLVGARSLGPPPGQQVRRASRPADRAELAESAGAYQQIALRASLTSPHLSLAVEPRALGPGGSSGSLLSCFKRADQDVEAAPRQPEARDVLVRAIDSSPLAASALVSGSAAERPHLQPHHRASVQQADVGAPPLEPAGKLKSCHSSLALNQPADGSGLHLVAECQSRSGSSQVLAMKEARMRDKNKRISQTNCKLMSMVVAFVLCWLPLNLFNLVQDFDDDLMSPEYTTHLFSIAHLMAYAGSCCNPILYAWMSDNYRQELRNVLPKFLQPHCPFLKT